VIVDSVASKSKVDARLLIVLAEMDEVVKGGRMEEDEVDARVSARGVEDVPLKAVKE
jgi:hypothetical protein